jgi:hypothetical protein
MSQDKKLRLVPPPGASTPRAPSDEAPPTEAEIAEAEALRALLEDGREPISNSLRAAHAPPALTEPDHDALLARALGDILAPPTRVEQAEAEHLAQELAGKVAGEGSEGLQLARALRSAHAPRPIDQITHERILKKALGAQAKPATRRGGTIAMVSGLFVAAAALAMFFTTARKSDAPAAEAVAQAPAPAATAAAGARAAEQRSDRAEKVAAAPARAKVRAEGGKAARGFAEPPPAAAPPGGAPPAAAEVDEARPAAAHGSDLTAVAAYVPSRSTDDLFDPGAQFPKTGGESARIDRIAMARTTDLRQNRFAAWGVR